ncbi:hypothetical protein [Hymenobacter daeguensis]
MKKYCLFLLAAVSLLACRKDDEVVCLTPAAAATNSFAALRLYTPFQRYTFDLSQALSLPTAQGARVAFGPNAFVLPNGNVATGQAELRVREIYSVADMMLADMPTTAQVSRQMLVSGGEFTIQVWQGSTRLRMSPVSPTGVVNRLTLTSPVPTAGLDTTRMYLWKQPASPLAGTPADSSGWLQVFTPNAANGSNPIRVNTTTSPATATTPYYSVAIPLDSIGNWNIDQFWSAYRNNPTVSVGVAVPVAAGITTRVYFRPVGYNGLARGFQSAASATFWLASLPSGADVVAVVLQENNGQLYYGTQRFNTAASTIVTPTLQALSAADIIQRIRQL